MPTPENINLIYDLERVSELAFQNYFTAAQIKSFTSQTMPTTGDQAADDAMIAEGWTIVDFQRDRPRVEIFASIGAGKGQFVPHPNYPAVECETTWDINFSLSIITAADMRIHAAYRSQIRYLIHAARGSINSVSPLANHYLAQFADGGTSPVIKSEEGDFETRINFSSTISVQRDAWALLT